MASGMEASKTMAEADVVFVIKGVDRERWVTITKIAILLKVGAAVAAKTAGVCCSRVSSI